MGPVGLGFFQVGFGVEVVQAFWPRDAVGFSGRLQDAARASIARQRVELVVPVASKDGWDAEGVCVFGACQVRWARDCGDQVLQVRLAQAPLIARR